MWLCFIPVLVFHLVGALGGSMHFNDNFHLDYTLNNQSWVEFRLEAKTLGWLGIGLWPGKNASMYGADYFIISVVDGKFVGGDYYLPAKAVSRYILRDPPESQDWNVTSFKENNGKTSITVKRLLDTGDAKHDQKIPNGPLWVMWAYSPNNSDDIKYHEKSVGHQFVNLHNQKMSHDSNSMPKYKENKKQEWKFESSNF